MALLADFWAKGCLRMNKKVTKIKCDLCVNLFIQSFAVDFNVA
jgi:hypothetical protein